MEEGRRGMLAADKTGLSPPLFSQTWHPRSTVRIKVQAVPFARHANVERPARCTCTRVLHRCARHSPPFPSLLLSQRLACACLPHDLSLLVIFVAMGLCIFPSSRLSKFSIFFWKKNFYTINIVCYRCLSFDLYLRLKTSNFKK